VLPVSLVLSTLRESYVRSLNAYRYVGDPDGAEAMTGIGDWLTTFLNACLAAASQATQLALEVRDLELSWHARIAAHRAAVGKRTTPRADSATAHILTRLTEVPVMTTATALRILHISFPAARAALENLAETGVLRRKTVDRGSTAYIADEVLGLITYAERPGLHSRSRIAL
jgi:Fic family protein